MAVFVLKSFTTSVNQTFELDTPMWYYAVGLVLVLTPISWVRDISKFSITFLLGNLLLLLTILTVSIDGAKTVARDGVTPGLQYFDESGFLSTIGFCVYAFEGIGVVMPIMQSCAEPLRFINLLYAAIGTLTIIYILFGVGLYAAYGYEVQPIVTENLPPAAISTLVIKFLFCINLMFGYSITIAPANRILEHWLFSGIAKGQKKYLLQNGSRFLVCLTGIYIAVELASKIDKFLGLLGALCCAPLALTLPATLHLVALAKTRSDKIFDVLLVIISIGILFFSTS